MKSLISEHAWTGDGFSVLMDFQTWRLGSLRFAEEFLPGRIARFQRHESCDEAFVLLSGHCRLLTGDGGDEVGEISATDMRPGRVYDIHRGVWHSHMLTPGSEVLVIENSDVTLENSPLRVLDEEQRRRVAALGAGMTEDDEAGG